MRKVKAAMLVLDFDLYPRNNIDSHNVRCMVDAIETGVEMPPIVIDKKSKRVVDGFHRVRAALKFYGEDGTVEVLEKQYKNEAAIFLDAMKYNGNHGARLDPCDRTRCIIIADRLHVPPEAVAGALHMPVDKLGALRVDRIAKSSGKLSLPVPLKRTNRHMAGKKITKKQEEANRRSSGMNQVFYVNQIIDLIEADLLDKKNENLLERLQYLHGLLEKIK